MGYVHEPDRFHRDLRILALHEAGLSLRRIAAIVGCDSSTVHEVVNPSKRAQYNARRAAHNTSPEGLERQRRYRARRAT